MQETTKTHGGVHRTTILTAAETHQARTKSYEYLWDLINGKRQDGIYAWSRNPWVFVIGFRKINAS